MRCVPLFAVALALFGCDAKTDKPTEGPKPAAQKSGDPAPASPKTQAKAPPAKAATSVKAAAAPAANGKVPAILTDIPAASTVFVAGLEGLDAMVRTLDSVVVALPAELKKDAPPELTDPSARMAKIGADLSTAVGWSKFGVDATAGGAVALDANLPDGPVLYLRITERKALIERLIQFGAKIERKGAADGIDEYLVDGKTAWVGERGEATVIYIDQDGKGAPETKARFAALLKDTGDSLSAEKAATRTFRDLGQGARYWGYVNARRAIAFAGQAAGQPVPHGDFIAKRLRAAGMAAGPATGGMRILTDIKGAAALAKIFKPSRAKAHFSRYFGSKGTLLMRMTVNPAEVFDGVADLIPPDLSAERGKVMIAKNAVPVAIGAQLADIASALSGHLAVAVDSTQLKQPQPPFVVLLDVTDREAADKVLASVLNQMKNMHKVPSAAVEVAGIKGTEIAGKVVVLRHEDAVMVGMKSMIEQAIGNSTPAQGALADAIDGDTLYGFVADVGTLIANLPPDAKMDPAVVRSMMKAVLGSDLVDNHLTGGFALDGDGIYATTGKSSTMMIGILAAIAIPAFVKYTRRAKASEARITLNSMRMSLMTKSLETPDFKLLGAPRSPAVKECDKYGPDPAAWAHPGWKQIGFAMHDPHYYQYELVIDAADPTKFVARAIGDLDCDGVESRFEIAGRVVNGQVEMDPLRVTNELE